MRSFIEWTEDFRVPASATLMLLLPLATSLIRAALERCRGVVELTGGLGNGCKELVDGWAKSFTAWSKDGCRCLREGPEPSSPVWLLFWVEVMVFSACDSGPGETNKGEWLLGGWDVGLVNASVTGAIGLSTSGCAGGIGEMCCFDFAAFASFLDETRSSTVCSSVVGGR